MNCYLAANLQTMHSENKNLIPVLALWSLMLLPWLFGRGIFADGLYYGTIARNWCFGSADIWDFQVSESLMNPFYSHPPLAFWMQGILFCVFGDSWWIERLFGLLTFFITTLAIIRIWRIYFPAKEQWLPLLMLLLFPTSVWAYNNNVLENSMGMFCAWAVYFQLSASVNPKWRLIKFLISGLFIFAAVLCKGPAGLFPLALPFFILLFQKRKQFVDILEAFVPAVVFIIALSLLMLWDEASKYLYDYYQIQIQGSFSTSGKNNQALMLKQFLLEVLPLFLITFLLKYWLSRKLKISKESIILLLIAASASLPILFSPKQMGFYLMPSLPFWALGLASIIQSTGISKKYNAGKISISMSVFLFVLSTALMIYNYKRPVRDIALLHELDRVCSFIPRNSEVGLDPKLIENWQLQGYFAREHNVSLYPIGHPKYEFNIGQNDYSLLGCKTLYKGKLLQLCKCPRPE